MKLTKGEQLLLTAAPPKVACALPSPLRREEVICFETLRHDLRAHVVGMLLRAGPDIGRFTPRECGTKPAMPEALALEDFVPRHSDVFRSFSARQSVAKAVASDAPFLSAYEVLVTDVVCTSLKRRLVALGAESDSAAIDYWYQYPPTLRLQPGPSDEHGREHRDAEFGHQACTLCARHSRREVLAAAVSTHAPRQHLHASYPTRYGRMQDGECNFWLPLTEYSRTCTTLWVESQPGQVCEC